MGITEKRYRLATLGLRKAQRMRAEGGDEPIADLIASLAEELSEAVKEIQGGTYRSGATAYVYPLELKNAVSNALDGVTDPLRWPEAIHELRKTIALQAERIRDLTFGSVKP